jgi:hypothetical protein
MPAPKIHSGHDRRSPFARRTSATMIASWTFLIRHGPAAARFTLRHTLSGYTPGLRSTGENISNPDAAKVSFPEAEISSFALSHHRLAEPRSGPLWVVRHSIGIDS